MRYFALFMAMVALAAEPAPVDCGPESLRLYGNKVQPFLLNACVQCHSGEKAGALALRRATPGKAMPPEIGQANLTAALRFVDRASPDKSPLLLKALIAHGGQSRPALKDTNAPAYKHLLEWCRLVAADGKTPPAGPGKADSPAPPSSDDPHDPAAFNRAG